MRNRGTTSKGVVVRGLGPRREIRIPGQVPRMLYQDMGPADPGAYAPTPIDYASLEIQNAQRIADEKKAADDTSLKLLLQAKALAQDSYGSPTLRNALISSAPPLSGAFNEMDAEAQRQQKEAVSSLEPSLNAPLVPGQDPQVHRALQQVVGRQYLALKYVNPYLAQDVMRELSKGGSSGVGSPGWYEAQGYLEQQRRRTSDYNSNNRVRVSKSILDNRIETLASPAGLASAEAQSRARRIGDVSVVRPDVPSDYLINQTKRQLSQDDPIVDEAEGIRYSQLPDDQQDYVARQKVYRETGRATKQREIQNPYSKKSKPTGPSALDRVIERLVK